MRPAASESNPANPIAGSWLAVFGSFLGSGVGAGCGCHRLRCPWGRCRCRCRCPWGRCRAGAAAGGVGMTTGTNLNVATSSSRRLSGSLSVSLSSLPVISTQRPSAASVILPFSGLSTVRASAPGSTVHVASGTLATGPFFTRANAYLSFFPPRTAVPRTRHPTAVTSPLCFLRQEAPIASLRVCGSDRHDTESKHNDRCTKKILMGHPDLLRRCEQQPIRSLHTSNFLVWRAAQILARRPKPAARRDLRTVRRVSRNRRAGLR